MKVKLNNPNKGFYDKSGNYYHLDSLEYDNIGNSYEKRLEEINLKRKELIELENKFKTDFKKELRMKKINKLL